MSDEPRDGQPDSAPDPVAAGDLQPTAATGDPEPTTADGGSPGSPPTGNPTGATPGDAAAEDGRTDGSRTDVSAPWERPRRWERSGPAANRVDALLARLDDKSDDDLESGEETDTRRSRRRNKDGEAIPAGALIAALGETDDDDDATAAPATAVDSAAPENSDSDSAAPENPDSDGAALDSQQGDRAEPETAATATPEGGGSPAGRTDAEGGSPVPHRDPDDDAHTDTFPRAVDKSADLAEAGAIRAALARQAGLASPGAAAGAPTPAATGRQGRKKAAVAAAAAAGAAASAAAASGAAASDTAGSGSGAAPGAAASGAAASSTGSAAGGSGTAGSGVASGAAAPTLVHGSGRRRRRGWLYAGRTVAALVALCTLLGVGVEWKIKDRAEVGLETHAITGPLPTNDPSISTARTTQMVVTNSVGVKTTESAPPKTVYKPENILLLGSDTRAGGNAAIGGSDQSTDGVANSDTLMVAHISGDRQHVTVLSIPRDTIITTPACRGWSLSTGKITEATATVHGGTYSHINTLYAVGGPQCTAAGVQSLTGLGITRIIGIDFTGFKAMVDALGGITVDVCQPIRDQMLGVVVAKGGVQVIGGAQAINLVRARDVIGDSQSDLARIHRQQVVLSAILRQVTQAGTLLNPGKLDGFLQAFVNNTFTLNVKLEDLLTLAGSLGSLDPAHVTFYTLPTVPSTTISGALDVDKAKAVPVFDDLINDLPLPGEVTTTAKPKPTATATPPAPTSLKLTVAPAKVVLELYNVTGRDNVAGTAQGELNAAGFKISDDQLFKPATTQTDTVVQYAPTNRAAALTVAAAVPGSTLLVTPGLGNTVRLQIGSSFAGLVKTVAVGQQAPASLSTAVSTGPSVTTSAGSATTSTGLSSVNAGAGTCA